MIEVEASQCEIEYARKYVATHDLGQRGNFDGNPRQQFLGILAEIVVANLLGIDRRTTEGFDGGFDLEYHGERIDVKNKRRAGPIRAYYAHTVQASQIGYSVERYVFCSTYKNEKGALVVQVCGTIEKTRFLRLATHQAEGTTVQRSDGTRFRILARGGTYSVTNQQLSDIREYIELPTVYEVVE